MLAARDWHIFTAAGNAWPEAYYFGMCILEEMQWIRTRPVHAADFFHGTLELVEPGVSVVVLKGEDAARPLAERVERFVPKVGGELTVIDTADLPAPGLLGGDARAPRARLPRHRARARRGASRGAAGASADHAPLLPPCRLLIPRRASRSSATTAST